MNTALSSGIHKLNYPKGCVKNKGCTVTNVTCRGCLTTMSTLLYVHEHIVDDKV